MSEMSKEVIGLLFQVLAVLAIVAYVMPRQLRDLSYPDDDTKSAELKLWLLFGSTIFLTLAIPPLLRLVLFVIFDTRVTVLDDIVFWCNRLIFIVIAMLLLALYKGNKREVDMPDVPFEKSPELKAIDDIAEQKAKEVK